MPSDLNYFTEAFFFAPKKALTMLTDHTLLEKILSYPMPMMS